MEILITARTVDYDTSIFMQHLLSYLHLIPPCPIQELELKNIYILANIRLLGKPF